MSLGGEMAKWDGASLPLCFSSPVISWMLCWYHTPCPLPSRVSGRQSWHVQVVGHLWVLRAPCALGTAGSDAQRLPCSVLQQAREVKVYIGVHLNSQEVLNTYFSGLWFVSELCTEKQKVF